MTGAGIGQGGQQRANHLVRPQMPENLGVEQGLEHG